MFVESKQQEHRKVVGWGLIVLRLGANGLCGELSRYHTDRQTDRQTLPDFKP